MPHPTRGRVGAKRSLVFCRAGASLPQGTSSQGNAHILAMVDALSPDPGMSPSSDLQRNVLLHLLAKVKREQFETWFRSLRVARADDREMEFSVTSQFVRDWIQKHHVATL